MKLSAANSSRPTVVVINGDDALAHALKFRFELEGFDVRVQDEARTLLALGMIPDDACLVVDHHLPGTDGFNLLTTLRGVGVKAPAVMIATNPNAALRAKAAEAGVTVVEKPLLNDALLVAVRSALILKIV